MKAATTRKKQRTSERAQAVASRANEAGGAPTFQAVIYGITILVSAFLFFQVELMMGKFVLPRFGGGPSVWSTSLLVFQLLLLAGYAYVTVICAKLGPKLQVIVHLSLLAVSALLLATFTLLRHSPILPFGDLKPEVGNPVWQIAWLLTAAVGVQCIVLSATSPLLQHWFSCQQRVSPYRLYALSNLGSMLGLLSYPFCVEWMLTLRAQAWVWAAGYAVFLVLAGASAVLHMLHPAEPAADKPQKPAKREKAQKLPRLLWLALAACASAMLLASTNLICQQLAAIPLLWVLPLSLYLVSFIICFDHARWYQREVFVALYCILALLALKVLPSYSTIPVAQLLLLYCAAMMAVCMVCHGELARSKPEPQHLTQFYLMGSIGGALGSVGVVLIAPQVFNRFWEFQIALLGCGILLVIAVLRDPSSWLQRSYYGLAMLFVAMVSLFGGAYVYTENLLEFEGQGDIVVARTRNFFGVKTVLNEPGARVLVHGHTLHGLQNTNPATRNEPTTYYTRASGIGLLLDHHPRTSGQAALRVGVIGMGAGTLAAYGRAGDTYRFYEVDPGIAAFSEGSRAAFTFMQSSPARVEVVLGDARIVMEDEVSRGVGQKFDVLVVDAFSGDSIPVHLLTQEAIALYLRQLNGPRSVIGLHLTNTSLDLRPLAEALAHSYRLATAQVIERTGASVWILLAQDPAALTIPELAQASHPIEVKRAVRLWTDDYSNLYQFIAN